MKGKFTTILRYTLPVLAGYVFLGFAFGFLMRTKGFPAWMPVLMSLVIYSGALEYAAVPMLSAAFDPIGCLVVGLMLSARHIFYGIPMLKKYAETRKIRPFLIFGLTDETFSILSVNETPKGIAPGTFYTGVTGLNFLYWVSGTALGAVLGGVIQLDAEGLDFALTALFVALYTEQLRTRQGKISGAIGLGVTLAALLLAGKSSFILIAMAGILAALLAGRRQMEHE